MRLIRTSAPSEAGIPLSLPAAPVGVAQTCPQDLPLLDRYTRSFPERGESILTRFELSLADVSENTRKAYNADVWKSVIIKMMHFWDFDVRYDPIACQLATIESLCAFDRSPDPLVRAVDSDSILEQALKLNSGFKRPGTPRTRHPPAPALAVVRCALGEHFCFEERGSQRIMKLRPAPERPLQVPINAKDRFILDFVATRFHDLLDGQFWSHFFRRESIGEVLSYQQRQLGNSSNTVARKMASLTRFEEFLRDSEILPHAIMAGMRRPAIRPAVQLRLDDDELTRIGDHLNRRCRVCVRGQFDRESGLLLRDRAMIALLDQTLIRAGALCGLEVGDIDLRRREIFVREKGRKQAIIPIDGHVIAVLESFLRVRTDFMKLGGVTGNDVSFVFHTVRGLPMNTRSLSRIVNERATDAGIERSVGGRSTVGAHVIRRSSGSAYLEQGARIEEISQLMNHSNIATTWRYVGQAKLDLRSAVRTRSSK